MTNEDVNRWLSFGIQNGASDIHLKVGDPPAYRVAGVLKHVNAERLTPADTEQICQMIIGSPEVRSRLNEIQEYDTSYSLAGVGRFRVNIFRQRGTLCIIMRSIPAKIPSLEVLGLPSVAKSLAAEERGLVLVTGATGSGKTTTLAAMIDQINQTRPAHILTIEDPIEYLHRNNKASISQREIGIDTRNFTVALRAALRQDPDVILVGEMRDAETVEIALKAAETGHMVFSTVHTTDAAKTISRLVAVFPAAEQHTARLRLADNLKGTVSQRLLPRSDGHGRVLACEVMVSTLTVQEYIRDEDRTAGLREVIEKGRDQYGSQSFDQHLADLVQANTISMDTAMSAATSPSDFERNMFLQA